MLVFWIILAVWLLNMLIVAITRGNQYIEGEFVLLVIASFFCIPLLVCIAYGFYWIFDKLNKDKKMKIEVSEGSKKRCREKFPIKKIGKFINSAVSLLDSVQVEIVISECIYDTDNKMLYNVLLYLIRENCKDEKILDELKKFNYEQLS